MLENVLSNPMLNTLALTLIHFVWQGVLIAGALKFVLLFISKQNPLTRYSLSCVAMLLCLLVPAVTFFWLFQYYSPQGGPLGLSHTYLPAIQNVGSNHQSQSLTWFANITEYLPYISMAWFIGVTILSLKLLLELFMVNQLPNTHTIPTSKQLEQQFHQLVKTLQLKKVPRLVISLKAEVPMAIGWIKPVVLMPASMLVGLTPSQLEMLLLHELAHIRRHDYLVNLLQSLVETLLFFHPAVMWISKQMRQEREYCSDDIAVAHCGDAVAYAHTLADTASHCKKHRHSTIPNMAMAASGGDLKQRVLRLVDHQCTNNNDAGKWLAGTMLGLSLLLIMSKQFITVPQINLTVGEMRLFKFYGKTTTTDKTLFDATPEVTLLETTIANQLISRQSTEEIQDKIATNNRPNLFLQPLTDVHAPKLVKLEVSPSTQNQTLNSEKLPQTTTSNAATQKQPSLVQQDKNLSSSLATAPATHSLDETTQHAINTQALHAHKDVQLVTETLSELASVATHSEINPYSSQISQLSQDVSLEQNTLLNEQLDMPVNNAENPVFKQSNLLGFTKSKPTTLITQQLGMDLASNQDKQLDVPVEYGPELLSASDPRYPSIAKRKGIELDIQVQFTIGKDGKIHDIEFEEQNRLNYFKSAIISAMEKWRFLPAQVNGQPVESQMSKIFSFNLS